MKGLLFCTQGAQIALSAFSSHSLTNQKSAKRVRVGTEHSFTFFSTTCVAKLDVIFLLHEKLGEAETISMLNT